MGHEIDNLDAMYSTSTCADMCWYAREKVCRCSCRGKNHGVLLQDGKERPARTKRQVGRRFQLMQIVDGWTPANDVAKVLQQSEMAARVDALPEDKKGTQVGRSLSLRASVVGGFDWSESGDHVVQKASPANLKWGEFEGRADDNPYLIWKML